ncbi:MAG: amidohydrolase, partial [Candidatus Dormibacteraeota bacterium]|nr:amidohydrolase [Candidatus Dormibacteraeota bacterium]
MGHLDLAPLADRVFDTAVDTRRHIHTYPELGFEEKATTALVQERLSALGLEELAAGTETGAVFR